MTPPLWQKVKRNSKASWWKWKGSGKAGLKLNIQKTKTIDAVSITSWQIGEKVESVTDVIFLGSKITTDRDCSHKIKRRLLLGRKAMTNLDNVLKSRHITLPTKVYIVQTMVSPAVMYRCESRTIKKANCQRTDAFELWYWRSPLDCKIKPANPKGNQPWISIGKTDAKAEAPILWPPDVKSCLARKDPDSGND